MAFGRCLFLFVDTLFIVRKIALERKKNPLLLLVVTDIFKYLKR